MFHDTGFPFLDGLKPYADRSGGDGEPRGDGKALAKTEEAPQALADCIRSLTPDILDLRKMKHRTPFTAIVNQQLRRLKRGELKLDRKAKGWLARTVS